MNRDGQPFKRNKPSPPASTGLNWARSDRTPGKGKRDGNCNRTACQTPLKGREQWYMRDYGTTNGRLYYCGSCARDFNASDRQYNEPPRCTFDDETDMSETFG